MFIVDGQDNLSIVMVKNESIYFFVDICDFFYELCDFIKVYFDFFVQLFECFCDFVQVVDDCLIDFIGYFDNKSLGSIFYLLYFFQYQFVVCFCFVQ